MAAEVVMVMLGDVYLQRQDPDAAFAPAQPYLRAADIGFCNLETVVADKKYLDPHADEMLPRTDEEIFPSYVRAGLNVYNIANNPCYYHGLACFTRQLEVLDTAGVIYCGGGRTIAEARRPAIVENCRSSGVATDEAIVSGSAPGREAST